MIPRKCVRNCIWFKSVWWGAQMISDIGKYLPEDKVMIVFAWDSNFHLNVRIIMNHYFIDR